MSALDRAKHIADMLGVNPNGTQSYHGHIIGPDTASAAALVGIQQALTAGAEQLERIATELEPKTEIQTPPEPAAISHALRERIALTKDALNAIGVGYRADWSDFDGRTLRDQLDNIICDILLGDDVTTAVACRNEFEQWATQRST